MNRSRVGPPRRLPVLPFLISRALFAGAILLLVHSIFPGVLWVSVLVDAYSTLLIPIDSGSFGLVGLMLIMGGALARGKRIGWIFTVATFGLLLLADLLTVGVLVVGTLVDSGTLFDLPAFAQVAFNLASLGAVFATLIVYRAEFVARRQPGNVVRALLTLITGLLVTFAVAMVFVSLAPGGLAGPRGRVGWIINQIVAAAVGSSDDAGLGENPPPPWITGLIGIMIAATLFSALLVLLRSQRRAALMSPSDEPRVRALIAANPEDSLAYFNTRRDKSVVFAEDGRSAISYRVTLGVCLASADPLGPTDCWPGAITAWQELIDTYGWTPAVIGASERGATAYDGAGLHVIRLGDEAVLEPREFHLDNHEMRPVRQAVQRLERLGYRTRIRRHADLGRDELAALIAKTDAWRDAESERGFSMALGRLGDVADGSCLLVEALFPVPKADLGPFGEVAGLLSFVPWGPDGFSLDVMRRSPRADNGVNELMVAHLMAAGRELGLHRVSLNFAVFRSAFEEGARIGAGPVLRLWRRLLLVASRWWQIESLYRSNVKYRPEWRPRFLCYAEGRDIALVGAASGVAEGFIDLPKFISPPAEIEPSGSATSAITPAEVAPASEPAVAEASPRVPEQAGLRQAVRQRLLDEGDDPYPVTFRPETALAGLAELEPGRVTSTAGRVLAVRDFGGVIFVVLQDWTGTGQLLLSADRVGRDDLRRLRRVIDIGDHLGASGTVGRSRTGELSLLADSWQLTAKSLRPLPNLRAGFTDAEGKVRQRYLDLIMNADARARLRARSAVLASVRETLQGKGFMEVETPMLQTVHGGANARPFRTHINAYDLELYLRIAPELYLKRLMVGGLDRVFEIGRNFRNEGADATHNPEFTMLEAYEAYGDYTTMRETTATILRAAAIAATGGTVVTGLDHLGARQEVDLAEPFRVVTVNAALSAAAGTPITADTEATELREIASGLGIAVDPRWSRGNVLLELYEHLCEHVTVAPTFFCDFPAEVSPLTRQHRDDPRLAERWDLVCFGAEIGTAYSELVDPVEQRARLSAQSLQAAGGDPEAMELDEDFLTALEYAMPPSGGLGMGMDRLVMMLTGATIRQTIAFPLVRPRRWH